MVKKCIICNEEANFKIKDSSEFYCQGCAEESFADLSLLQKVVEESNALKQAINYNLDAEQQSYQDQ